MPRAARPPHRALRLCATLTLAGAPLLLPACSQRTLSITSQPEGAMVWLNDVEVGRTPVDVDFKWFGTYDVRVVKEGYEPLLTSREAVAPPHEYPVLDLITAPLPLHTRLAWHFDLTPTAESIDKLAAERELLDRAAAMRTAAGPAPARGDAPATDAPTAAPTQAPAPTTP